jgi:NADPH-dependent 2,4-dienoyl-CoA reductase/sulfur reductase-like enzyme
MSHLVIVGGSDAGISAALRAREVDASTQVTLIVEDAFPNYSICGLPFYLSGEVPDYHQLAHRTREEITGAGIDLLLDHRAKAVDPGEHLVTVVDWAEHVHQLSYDRLVLSTGARSRRPHIDGLDLPGVFLLHSMEDSFQIQHYLATHPVRSALIVGGGYIGVQQISAEEARLCVSGTGALEAYADLVVVAAGVQPRTELAQGPGIERGVQGATRVSRTMATSIPDIFAAGDCVETWHRVIARPTYLPLGTTAHKQGRIAGENAVGGERLFAGTVGTQVVKVFDLAIARTGLREHEARAVGFDPFTVEGAYFDHKVYYPGAQTVHVRLTGDRATGRFLGAQLVGPVHTEVAKRIDTYATALFHEMTVEALSDLDLSYTPPLGSPWDLVQMGAQEWSRSVGRRQ